MTTIALIFPGQGSQSAGMLKELATVYPAVQRRFIEASDILGLDLWHISMWPEMGASFFTIHNSFNAIWMIPRGDNHMNPGIRCNMSRLNFRIHAACT